MSILNFQYLFEIQSEGSNVRKQNKKKKTKFKLKKKQWQKQQQNSSTPFSSFSEQIQNLLDAHHV